MNFRFVCLFVAILCSCTNAEKKGESENTTLQYNEISLIKSLPELIANDHKDALSAELDTMELTYMAYACDCPSWVQLNEHDQKTGLKTGLAVDSSYYIEPADTSLLIDNRLMVAGNTIRFIGRKYMNKRIPDNAEFTDPEPPSGIVLRYYSYQVVRPYKTGE